jgi:lysophospholipase L1-like esterase
MTDPTRAETFHGYAGGQRILILGDSISESGDYRRSLFDALTDAGAAHGSDFDFVGARNSYQEHVDDPALFTDSSWDHDHEAHGGLTTEQLLIGRWGENNANNTGMVTARANGKWAYANNAADIACIVTGTNDIGYDWGKMVRDADDGVVTAGESVPLYAVHETIHDIRNVVAFLREQNPNVRIALSTGIPTTEERRHYAPGTLEALKDEIIKLVAGTYVVPENLDPAPSWAQGNSGIDNYHPTRPAPSTFIDGGIATPDSPVALVDLWTGFDPATMTSDDIQLHPNAAGGELMGSRFADALLGERWVVPEPTTMMYVGLGAAGLAGRRRKKKAATGWNDKSE